MREPTDTEPVDLLAVALGLDVTGERLDRLVAALTESEGEDA